MDRRKFLQQAGAFAGAVTLSPALKDFEPVADYLNPSKIGVLQGPTSASTTLISVVMHKQWRAQFLVEGGDLPVHLESHTIDLGYNDFLIYNLRVSGMVLGVNYELRVLDWMGTMRTRRFFRALDWAKSDGQLAVMSCSNHRNAGPQKIMSDRLREANPDAVLFLGDLVYANDIVDTVLRKPASLPVAYQNYVKTFLELDLYQAPMLVPVFSVWDDHDAGQDNADSSHPFLDRMSRMFRAFYPAENFGQGYELGPGQSFALNIFGVQILTFDQRTFSSKTVCLGREQMAWAKEQINSARGPLLIATPLLVWRYHFWGESFQKNSASELSEFLELLRGAKRPCLFASGDVHYSQIAHVDASKIGFPTFELTSSAFFSRPSDRWGRRSDPTQLNYYGFPNFLMLDQFRSQENSFELRVTCVSENSTSQFTRNLRIAP